jgi:protein involved in polysaccharide export with SLBB domain
VDGAVRRPAIYELRSGETLSELINFSGGFSEGADLKSITVVEYSERGDRRALKFDFSDPVSTQTTISAGSEVIVRRFGGRLDSVVFLEGHVEQPGISKWFEGMTILDLLPSLRALKVGADPRYVLIRRERDDGLISAVSVDLQELLEASDSRRPAPALERRDRVMIFDGSVSRGQRLEPLLRELRLQTSPADPVKIVSVSGAVRWPGQYPLEPGMRVSDLIRAAGGLADQAFQKQAEISRLSISRDGSRMASELISVDLAAALERESRANFSLASRDALVVKPLPDSAKREFVTVRGEVMFPGEYPIQRGETLRAVIERAGGLTPLGFARGAVFTRESLREREAKQIEKLEASLRQELATSLLGSVQAGSSAGAVGNSQAAFGLLDQLQQSEAVGRLVIDLDRLLGGAIGSRSDVILRGGDQLLVPSLPQEVSVIGEVSLPTSHLYRADFSLENYLMRSGGFTDRADKSRVYVVKSDGTVVHPRRSLLGAFVGSDRVRLEPGDTVVVPPDVAQLPPLAFWQAVTSIIYNAAVAVAAVRSF